MVMNQPIEAALTVSQRRNGNNNYTWRGSAQSTSQPHQYRGRGDQIQRRALVCYKCDREGHKAYECPDRVNRMNAAGRRELRRDESMRAAYAYNGDASEFVLVMDKHNEITGWLIDSGASHHITNDKSMLLNYHRIEKQAINGFTESSMDYAIGEGDVKLPVILNGAERTITITSVWYVPGAQKNLLSVSALMNKGCTLVFKDNKCVVSIKGVELFTAALKSKLFAINTVASHTAVVMAAHGSVAVNPHVTALWHRRMGHASEQLIHSMMSSDAVFGMDRSIRSNTAMCEGCVMGKHTRDPFKQQPAQDDAITVDTY